MPPNQPNQYDFILNNPKPKRSFNLGGNKTAQFAVLIGGVILLIILFMLAMSFMNSGNNAQKAKLIEIAQAQNEIIRVSALADKKTKQLDTASFAYNTKLSVISSQADVKKILTKYGVKEKSLKKPLSQSVNPKNDAALTEATQNNRFDETFLAMMDKQLSDYQKLLKNAHTSATTDSEKKTLKAAFDNVNRLSNKQTATSQ